ncbi:MAG: peptide deformylase [Syntrophobacteraceae bacterium]
MSVLEIRTYPDPVLRRKAEPIEKVDSEIRKLIDDMAETMYKAPGVGLAANQVGMPIRVVVVDLQKSDNREGLLVLINPKIVSSQGSITFEEGCLSIPEFFSNVKRCEEVTVEALDRDEKPLEIAASGLLAVVLQHEIDHLEGKLFIDRLGPITRDIFKRKWKKQHKEAHS